MVTDERRAVAPGTRENKQIRGHSLALAETKRQDSGSAVAFNGVLGVDSQDILNAPNIDFGTFQLFPDQNNYGANGGENQAPSVDFNTMLTQTTNFITSQAQSAQAVGKPVICTGFGLVTEGNLGNFVPFNSVFLQSPQPQNPRRQVATLATGVSQGQINTAYTTWLQTGFMGGVSGMSQYQFSAQNLVPATGTLVQGSPGTSGALGQSPNDGYAIAGPDTSGVQTILTTAAQNFT
jgi:mannan endo-1,4-beta-mannosidase